MANLKKRPLLLIDVLRPFISTIPCDNYLTVNDNNEVEIHFPGQLSQSVLLQLILFCLNQEIKFYVTDDVICKVNFVVYR